MWSAVQITVGFLALFQKPLDTRGLDFKDADRNIVWEASNYTSR